MLVTLVAVLVRTARQSSRPGSAPEDPRAAELHVYEFPALVRLVHAKHHPERTLEQADLAFKALKDFFVLMFFERKAGRNKSLGMPSVLADEAWHAFVLCTKDYEAFCVKFFGKVVHHVPDPTSEPHTMTEGSVVKPEVLRTWQAATSREDSRGQYLSAESRGGTPLLFATDAGAGVTPGWIWTPAALGMLAAAATQAQDTEREGSGGGDGGVSSAAAGCGGASASGDCGGSSDGGGSGDGGSCGGGCGGGGGD